MIHKMLFQDARFRETLDTQITVRLGRKWFNALKPRDQLKLCDAKTEEIVARAKVTYVACLPLFMVQQEWIRADHIEGMSSNKLFELMCGYYGDFTWNDLVTVVFFKL